MFGRRRTLCFLIALFCALPITAGARVVAVGDVHGSYEGLVTILKEADLIDDELHWSGGESTFIQTGDLLDRGSRVREVMDLLMRLQIEAAADGGAVIVLLGNHDAMNLLGIFRDAAPELYENFVDKKSAKRRNAAYKAFKKIWTRRLRNSGLGTPNFAAIEESWFEARPLGMMEYVESLSTDGVYGRWLRTCKAAVILDETLFVHGGFGPMVEGWTVEEINQRVVAELSDYDTVLRWAVANKEALASASIFELVQAVEEARKEAAALEAPLDREMIEIEDQVKSVEGWADWILVNPEGPLWFRGAALWDEEVDAPAMVNLLDGLGVKRMVVGHTPQRTHDVMARFGNRVFLIDTGMLEPVYKGRASALEILDGEVTAIYPGGVRQPPTQNGNESSEVDAATVIP